MIFLIWLPLWYPQFDFSECLSLQDAAQEMEGYLATFDLTAWPGSAWLLLSFSPFPVWHPSEKSWHFPVSYVNPPLLVRKCVFVILGVALWLQWPNRASSLPSLSHEWCCHSLKRGIISMHLKCRQSKLVCCCFFSIPWQSALQAILLFWQKRNRKWSSRNESYNFKALILSHNE